MGVGDFRRKRVTRRIICVNVRKARLCCLIASLLLGAASASRAEELPIKTYTSADGLVRDQINRIVRDSLGFLWFCTSDGLSRFDGYTFSNYTTDNGLPGHGVNDLLETRSGVYWVATNKGVSRFNLADPAQSTAAAQLLTAEPKFVTYYPGQDAVTRNVNILLEDHTGAIWCGTNRGVFRLEPSGDQVSFRFIDLGMPNKTADDAVVEALLEDRQGAIWVGTRGSGLYRYLPDGHAENFTTKHGLPDIDIRSLLEDHEGRLWVGTKQGLCLLIPQPNANGRIVARVYNRKDGLAGDTVTSLFQSADGVLWVGLFGGLSRLVSSPASSVPTVKESAPAFRSYSKAQGLEDIGIWALAEDLDGNLWLGTQSSGAIKIARTGFTTLSEADGLGSSRIQSIFENRAGELCVVGTGIRAGREWTINQFDGKSFTATRPNVPKRTYFGWGWNQIAFQDHMSEWWVPTGYGLYRFPKLSNAAQLAHTRPKAVYTTRDGLPLDAIFRLYEDSRGDVWIATSSNTGNGLTRWERATETFHNYSENDNLPSLKDYLPSAFSEDASGNLWIGFNDGDLARYTGGRFKLFKQADGLPGGWIRAIFADRADRLWIAAGQGLSRIDDPVSAQPHFQTLTTADGLSSNSVWCVTEDPLGHIYIGTSSGLDRLDPATGHTRHYTSGDGLARGEVEEAFRDSHGVLWFGTVLGLSRLIPEPDRPQSPPPVLITGLRVAGVARSVADSEERLVLGPYENQVQIDFVGLAFSAGEGLRYQYRLEGADRDWNTPSDHRTVNYASLRSGNYRFLVRAVTADGVISPTPATVTFTILPPVWQRWWFLTLAVLFACAVGYQIYRYRVARLLGLERVRTRIATDLHDEIGSNLSLMAMVSELANKQAGPKDPQMTEWLSLIAGTSRETMDSMSDIVWVINPDKDRLADLTLRMRRVADDMFTARNIGFHFSAPGEDADVKLEPDTRNEVFMIFKESVNNIARHSECTRADIEFKVEKGGLELKVSDNGRGFDPAAADGGNGLSSMRRRAKNLGGKLELVSFPEGGTTVILRAPLDGHAKSKR